MHVRMYCLYIAGVGEFGESRRSRLFGALSDKHHVDVDDVSVETKLSFVESGRRWAHSPYPVNPLVFLTRVL